MVPSWVNIPLYSTLMAPVWFNNTFYGTIPRYSTLMVPIL